MKKKEKKAEEKKGNQLKLRLVVYLSLYFTLQRRTIIIRLHVILSYLDNFYYHPKKLQELSRTKYFRKYITRNKRKHF